MQVHANRWGVFGVIRVFLFFTHPLNAASCTWPPSKNLSEDNFEGTSRQTKDTVCASD